MNAPPTQRRIFRYWLPMAAAWLMMACEGPFIAAVIARLGEPKLNLAAFSVAFVLAMLAESPIILILSASTALVEDRDALRKLRRFTYALNAAITVALALFVLPPVFVPFARGLLGLPPEVAALANRACALLLPWPAAIGYRRFHQGILIRGGQTRRVAYGTAVRLVAMSCSALLFASFVRGGGALVGGASLAVGVVAEAVASRLMAASLVRRIEAGARVGPETSRRGEPLTYGGIWRFYYPLLLTSLLNLGVNPLVTFFLGRSRLAVESLAAMQVVNPFVFFFASLGLALQEVAIALMGAEWEGRAPLRRFATRLALLAAAGFAVVAFTPLLDVWLLGVQGLRPDLADVARPPLRLLALMPLLSVAQCYLRAVFVSARATRPITIASAIEIGGIAVALAAGVGPLGFVGATAAACALLFGRAVATGHLVFALRAL